MYSYFNQAFSKNKCGFWQGHNTQRNLLVMLEKLRKSLTNSDVSEMLLIDLSKTFGCLRHDLSIAKLTPYGFDQLSLCFYF